MTKSLLQESVHGDGGALLNNIGSNPEIKHDADQFLCKHCNTLIPSHRLKTGFCCSGCMFVFELIHNESLGKFYKLKSNSRISPKILLFKRKQNADWVDAIDFSQKIPVECSIEGIECTACVWLIKTLAKRMGIGLEVNSAIGKIRVYSSNTEHAKLKELFLHLQDFGYRVFPNHKESEQTHERERLLMRMGIVSASVMNSMMFSFAIYLGLNRNDPFFFNLFSYLNFLFCTLAVGVGGSYFFKKAWLGLKMKLFHFDLPVSIGMIAAYLGSCYSYFWGHSEHVYFDTLCTFIFLMLVGRFLQVRWVEKNRSLISSTNDFESLTVKKIEHTLIDMPVGKIQKDDRLLIPSGAMIPVDAVLESPDSIEISQEWITGESDAVNVQASGQIVAGSRNISRESLIIRSNRDYKSGDVGSWMFFSSEKKGTASFWQTYAQKYSLLILSLLGFGFLFFAFTDLERAIKTAVTISLVTCPCGIGIGIPMAQMVAQRKLLASGIYLRDLNLLEHLKSIKTLVFDKTGTITLSELHIKNPEAIDALNENDLTVLYNAAAQSQHPVCRTIYSHLMHRKIAWKKVKVEEIAGKGLEILSDGIPYYIGRSAFNREVIFTRGPKRLLNLQLDETLLEDAQNVFKKLGEKYAIHILSGDKKDRVEGIAKRLGLKKNQFSAECKPEDKKAWIDMHSPNQILFLGDGLNDTLALRTAMVSGASLSDSLSLASNANFYFSTLDIRWLPQMLNIGEALSTVIHRNIIFSIFYNCTAVILAMVGILTPLVAAIVMPAVSLAVVGVSMKKMKSVSDLI